MMDAFAAIRGFLRCETWLIGVQKVAFCVVENGLLKRKRSLKLVETKAFRAHNGGFCRICWPFSLHMLVVRQPNVLIRRRLCLHTKNGRIHARRILFSE